MADLTDGQVQSGDTSVNFQPAPANTKDGEHNPKDTEHNPQDKGNNPQDDRNDPQDQGNNPQDDGNNPQDDGNDFQDDGNDPQDDGNNPQDQGNNPQDQASNPQDAEADLSIITRINNTAFECSCIIHRLFFKVLFTGIFLIGHILLRLQYSMGLVLRFVHGHDNALIHHSPALKDFDRPNMRLYVPFLGASGSCWRDWDAYRGQDMTVHIPSFRWTLPQNIGNDSLPMEYVFVCEDPDWPVPGKARLHCLFYGIPPHTRELRSNDIRPDRHTPCRTLSDWTYLDIRPHGPYYPPDPLFGHGEHRYIFTVIALRERILFPSPSEVTKDKFLNAIKGKVVGYGQWEGRYSRPWSSF